MKMKVSAREARRFLAFWALGFAENLEKPKEMKVFGARSAPILQVKTLAWSETLVKP